MSCAYQFPPLLRDLVGASYRLHEDIVRNAGFRYPDCAKEVYPVARHRLFERSTLIRTQYTLLQDYNEAKRGEDTPALLTTGTSGETVHFLQSH